MTLSIQNTILDTDTTVYLTKEAADPSSFSIKADGTREIVLPKTVINTRILGYLNAPLNSSTLPYQTLPCNVLEGNTSLVTPPATLHILSTQSDGYHCAITSGNSDILTLAKNLSCKRTDDNQPFPHDTLGVFQIKPYDPEPTISAYILFDEIMTRLDYDITQFLTDDEYGNLFNIDIPLGTRKAGTDDSFARIYPERYQSREYRRAEDSNQNILEANIHNYFDPDIDDFPKAFDTDNVLRYELHFTLNIEFPNAVNATDINTNLTLTFRSGATVNIHFVNGQLQDLPGNITCDRQNLQQYLLTGDFTIDINTYTDASLHATLGNYNGNDNEPNYCTLDLSVSYTTLIKHNQQHAVWYEECELLENILTPDDDGNFKQANSVYDYINYFLQANNLFLTPSEYQNELILYSIETLYDSIQKGNAIDYSHTLQEVTQANYQLPDALLNVLLKHYQNEHTDTDTDQILSLRPLQLEATLHLTPQEFEQFNHYTPYFLQQYAAYFYIPTLADYNPQTQQTTATLIRL